MRDAELIDAVCAAAALALENQQLQAALRARIEELRASRARVVDAANHERRAIDRNLHDGAQQRLVALSLTLRLAQSSIERDPGETRELLGEASDQLGLAIDELRELARGIHPAVLSDGGLEPALQALCSRTALPVSLDVGPDRASPTVCRGCRLLHRRRSSHERGEVREGRARRRVGIANERCSLRRGRGRRHRRRGPVHRLRSRWPGRPCRGAGGQPREVSPNGVGTTLRAEIPIGTGLRTTGSR